MPSINGADPKEGPIMAGRRAFLKGVSEAIPAFSASLSSWERAGVRVVA
jgi:hypothetical protein